MIIECAVRTQIAGQKKGRNKMESEGQRDRAKSMWMIAILASVYLNGELGQ